jgi:hypothetical protein
MPAVCAWESIWESLRERRVTEQDLADGKVCLFDKKKRMIRGGEERSGAA